MELLEAIGKRRSVRAYREGRIARETVLEILRAGTLAPSGKNGQPWRFAVVQENRARFAEIAALTVYRAFAERADCLVLVFLDKAESYLTSRTARLSARASKICCSAQPISGSEPAGWGRF